MQDAISFENDNLPWLLYIFMQHTSVPLDEKSTYSNKVLSKDDLDKS